MSPTRRSALEAALAAAVAAATPESLFALQGRAATNANERFLVVALKDGRRLAVDRLEGKQAYLLTSTAASDGEYTSLEGGQPRRPERQCPGRPGKSRERGVLVHQKRRDD